MDPDINLIHNEGSSDWGISSIVLEYLSNILNSEMRTIETGAGFSTIIFAKSGCRHICITPSESELTRIRDICSESSISLDNVEFINDFSENVVPFMNDSESDLVLIDGGHGFPIPSIDFFYLGKGLKIGGLLLIDDVDLWTGKMIVDFLRREPGWEYQGKLARRTAVFEKKSEFIPREWCDQPTVVRKSRHTQLSREFLNGCGRLLSGDLAGVQSRIAEKFR